MKTFRKIKSRWLDDAGQKHVSRIHEIISQGGDIPATISPFPEVDNLIDLRGFPFKFAFNIKSCKFKNTDLSYCSLENGWIEKSHFINIRFDDAILENLSDHGNSFEQVSFARSILTGSVLGYNGSKYIKCKYYRALLIGAGSIRAEFNYCIFDHCIIKGVDFNATSFENCKFIGKVVDVWFHGGFPREPLGYKWAYGFPTREEKYGKPRKNRMLNVDFSEAELWDLTLSDGCDLSTIILPKKGNYRLYSHWRKRLIGLWLASLKWPRKEGSETRWFCKHLLGYHQDWYLINIEKDHSGVNLELFNKIIDFLDRYQGLPFKYIFK